MIRVELNIYFSNIHLGSVVFVALFLAFLASRLLSETKEIAQTLLSYYP